MADIEGKVVKVLSTRDGGKYGVKRVRIVRWIVDGRDTGPRLEKRTFFMDGDMEKTGKAEGFALKDVEMLRDQIDEIIAIMQENPAQ